MRRVFLSMLLAGSLAGVVKAQQTTGDKAEAVKKEEPADKSKDAQIAAATTTSSDTTHPAAAGSVGRTRS